MHRRVWNPMDVAPGSGREGSLMPALAHPPPCAWALCPATASCLTHQTSEGPWYLVRNASLPQATSRGAMSEDF